MDEMRDNIFSKYPQVKKVDVYGRIIKEVESGNMKSFPKSTVIGKHEPHDEGIGGNATRPEIDTLLNVRDTIFQREKIPGYNRGPDSQLEAGEIRIVIETDTDIKAAAKNFGWGRYLPDEPEE